MRVRPASIVILFFVSEQRKKMLRHVQNLRSMERSGRTLNYSNFIIILYIVLQMISLRWSSFRAVGQSVTLHEPIPCECYDLSVSIWINHRDIEVFFIFLWSRCRNFVRKIMETKWNRFHMWVREQCSLSTTQISTSPLLNNWLLSWNNLTSTEQWFQKKMNKRIEFTQKWCL